MSVESEDRKRKKDFSKCSEDNKRSKLEVGEDVKFKIDGPTDFTIQTKSKEIKSANDFSIKNFRSKLRGTDFISEIRQFVHLTKTRPKMVSKYIEKKGNPVELAEVLERIDKSNLIHISYICQALQLVLMEILTNEKMHIDSAINASRYMLKSHGKVIESLLKSPSVENRKCILKLLTAVVCLEPQLGRHILTSFDTVSNPKSMEDFLLHSKEEKHGVESVRKCYIHFLLSYIIDGNILLIRNVLDKYNLISSLFSGLAYDDHVTVCVVLNTFKKYVLENLEVSKTKKVHVFDIANVKHIIRLYQWKGPRDHEKKENKSKSTLESDAEFNERKAVEQAAHEFLVILLSSRKYGIAFDTMSNMRQKHNHIQSKVLAYLDAPWLNELKMDLVLKILTACPELARNTIKRYSFHLSPNKTKKGWNCIANFIEKLISNLHPSIMRGGLEKITLTDVTLWIKDICLCPEALVNLKGAYTLKSEDYSIRIGAVKLLLAMFRQFSNYMNAILRREKLKGNDLRKFKFDILNHIFLNFPTIQSILVSLYKTIKSESRNEKDISEHLEVTLDLILIVSKNCRSFVDKTSAIVDYIEILHPLYESQTNDENTVRLELKAIKTILVLLPKSLHVGDKHFNHVINSFINTFVHGIGNNQKEAGVLLRRIFFNLDIFENASLEIDLWIESLKFVSPKCRDSIKTIFPDILQTKRPLSKMPENEIDNDLQVNIFTLFENIENDVSIQSYVEKPTLSKLCTLFHAFLRKSDDECANAAIKEYLDIVFLLLFHYFPTPRIVQSVYSKHHETHCKYMLKWLDSLKPGKFLCESIPKYSEMYKSILAKEENFIGLFGCSKDEPEAFSFMIGENEIFVNKVLQSERLILIYIYQVIFLVAQLVKSSDFDENFSRSCLHYLKNLLHILFCLQNREKLTSEVQDPAVGGEDTISFLEQALKYIYCNHLYLLQSFNLFEKSSSSKHFLNFMCELTKCVSNFKLNNFDEIIALYRVKVTKQLISNINSAKNQNELLTNDIIKVLEAIQMSTENCIVILESLSKLSAESFFTSNSCRSVYFDILIYVLSRLAELKIFKVDKEVVVRVSEIYTELVEDCTSDINLEKFEDTFHNFLTVSYQSISYLSEDCFLAMFKSRKITKTTVRLASLILNRRNEFNEVFMKAIPSYISKRELIYPLLNVIISKNLEIDLILLNTIYEEYKSGFLKTIEKPQKAGAIYKENVKTSTFLIETCMPVSECLDFCKKNLKIDTVELFQLKIIEGIYRKAIKVTDKDTEAIFVSFMNTIIQLFLVIFRRDQVDHAKIETLAFMAYDWIQRRQANKQYNFDKILKSQSWQHFCKNCLKLGMQAIEIEGQVIDNCNDKNNSSCLKILGFLCDNFYDDACNQEGAQELFEMIISHSRFLDIALNQQYNEVKTHLMYLYFILVRKNKNIIDQKHIPILLGAYQAKLSFCDRYILALLQFYEENGVSLNDFRPFVWGDSAISHYSLENEDEKLNVNRYEPLDVQVMSLIDSHTSDFTIANFPVWRKLNTLRQIPEISFYDPSDSTIRIGTNRLQRDVEKGLINFESSLIRLCTIEDKIYEDCYDPAFFIPLMSTLFAPEMYFHPVRPVQNGLLAIAFASLSSLDKNMRLAAGCVQVRYRQHFESSKFFDKPLWMQVYDNIQSGLDNLSTSWLKYKKIGVPRAPYISGLFLAKSITLLKDPTNPLYRVLTMYLRLKNTFSFLCIPEFNVLFHSPEIEHHTFRRFILEIIRDGIKCSSDMFLLVSTSTFKPLLGFYGSTMSNLEINLLILSVVNACCKIPASSKLMIEHVGIIPWLGLVIENLEYYHFDTIESIIRIINDLWYSVKIKESDFPDFKHIQTSIFYLLITLSRKISGRISLLNYVAFLNILCKTAVSNSETIGEEDLDKIIYCAQRHFESEVWYINNIKANGIDGIESSVSYVKKLKSSGLDDVSILGLLSLRNLVVSWLRN